MNTAPRFPEKVWIALLVGLAMVGGNRVSHARQAALVPETVELAEPVRQALAAEWLTEDERAALRVFHGVWNDDDLITPNHRAMVELNAWRADAAIFDSPTLAVEFRAEAMRRVGDLHGALNVLDGATSIAAARIRAESYEAMGRHREASDAVRGPVRELIRRKTEDAEELTEGVRAMMVRARVDGQPARDFQTMLDLLGRAHQQLDRLYWPARLIEARLLIEKDQDGEAIAGLHELLALNPRCAEAWFWLGRLALDRFDFASNGRAVAALHRLNRQHPLAALLIARERLVEDDPDGAIEVLDRTIAQWPGLRDAQALRVAAVALMYDDAALDTAIAQFDVLSPGSALAHYEAGRALSMNRQYELAATMLEEAIRRQPSWPAPQIELGLMELQAGRDAHALDVLTSVTALDPFNTRAVFSQHLLQELAEYREIESEHFVLRYLPGIDEVVADLMLEPLEEIHATVAGRFAFEPAEKTIIELHPGHERFAVRITGMPHVHTIAACTGPVIALEVPREGPAGKHSGPFDWRRVIQHEYTHTVTLAQTRNRIPHWLTEAAAVSMEQAPRDYSTCVMLADSYAAGTLFTLDEIKWAFVRPAKPGDRGKAYAQGHWMVEYMEHRFGPSSLVRLLGRYHDGEREDEAIPGALGVSREQFYRDFLKWAGTQVKAWGLNAQPSLESLMDDVRWSNPETAITMAASVQARLDVLTKTLTQRIGMPRTSTRKPITAGDWPPLVRPDIVVSNQRLEEWRATYPNHADLLEALIRRRLVDADHLDSQMLETLERYREVRPVDPFPHKKLAQHWLETDMPERAIEHLEALDVREEYSAVFALELARQYRAAGNTDRAYEKALRAVQIHPYQAANRELAATAAIEANRLSDARLHIKALTLLEPGRARHARRLAAIERLIEKSSG